MDPGMMRPSPRIVRVMPGKCEWAVSDKDGMHRPHGIRAIFWVYGTGFGLDGLYCVKHAKMAVQWFQDSIEPLV